MREVDDHAEAIHFVDDAAAFVGDAAMKGWSGDGGAVSEEGEEGCVGIDVMLGGDLSASCPLVC